MKKKLIIQTLAIIAILALVIVALAPAIYVIAPSYYPIEDPNAPTEVSPSQPGSQPETIQMNIDGEEIEVPLMKDEE